MTAATTISTYQGAGLAASRPASPSVPSGGAATYYATDTGVFSIWDGSAWHNFTNQTRAAPTVVQSTSNFGTTSTINGATFGSAPTSGNLLIAIGFLNSNVGANSTWHRFGTSGSFGDTGAGVNLYAFYRWAGASEPAAQTVCNSNARGCIIMFEVSGAVGMAELLENSATSATSISGVITTRSAAVLTIGAFMNWASTDLPSSLTGVTSINTGTSTGGGFSASANWGKIANGAAGSVSVAANYPGTEADLNYAFVNIAP